MPIINDAPTPPSSVSAHIDVAIKIGTLEVREPAILVLTLVSGWHYQEKHTGVKENLAVNRIFTVMIWVLYQ